MYPNSATTYKLPFDDRIRVSSRCAFVLVRQFNETDSKPFIVRRSDNRATLEKLFDPATDYLIDQTRGLVTYSFNGKLEVFDGIEGKHVYYGPGPFTSVSSQAQ
jgi:hypothetical protein